MAKFAWNGNHRLKRAKRMWPFHARRKGLAWNTHHPHSTLCGTSAFHANFIYLHQPCDKMLIRGKMACEMMPGLPPVLLLAFNDSDTVCNKGGSSHRKGGKEG